MLNVVSTLAIWPVSEIGPLVESATLKRISNGPFFVTMPITIGRMMGSSQAAVTTGMAIVFWTRGSLKGTPIAGMLIAANGADEVRTVTL